MYLYYKWHRSPKLRLSVSVPHDYVIKWKHLRRYWFFMRRIHRWPADSPHNGQWRSALMFSLICDTVEQTIETPVIWDAIDSNELDGYKCIWVVSDSSQCLPAEIYNLWASYVSVIVSHMDISSYFVSLLICIMGKLLFTLRYPSFTMS